MKVFTYIYNDAQFRKSIKLSYEGYSEMITQNVDPMWVAAPGALGAQARQGPGGCCWFENPKSQSGQRQNLPGLLVKFLKPFQEILEIPKIPKIPLPGLPIL